MFPYSETDLQQLATWDDATFSPMPEARAASVPAVSQSAIGNCTVNVQQLKRPHRREHQLSLSWHSQSPQRCGSSLPKSR